MIWPARNSLKTWINWTQRRIASINQRPTSKGTNQRVLRGVCGWHGVEDGPKSCHLYCRTRPQPWSRATAQAAADPQNRRPRLVETARPTLGTAAPVCTRIAGRTVVHDAYTVCEAPFWALSLINPRGQYTPSTTPNRFTTPKRTEPSTVGCTRA